MSIFKVIVIKYVSTGSRFLRIKKKHRKKERKNQWLSISSTGNAVVTDFFLSVCGVVEIQTNQVKWGNCFQTWWRSVIVPGVKFKTVNTPRTLRSYGPLQIKSNVLRLIENMWWLSCQDFWSITSWQQEGQLKHARAYTQTSRLTVTVEMKWGVCNINNTRWLRVDKWHRHLNAQWNYFLLKTSTVKSTLLSSARHLIVSRRVEWKRKIILLFGHS